MAKLPGEYIMPGVRRYYETPEGIFDNLDQWRAATGGNNVDSMSLLTGQSEAQSGGDWHDKLTSPLFLMGLGMLTGGLSGEGFKGMMAGAQAASMYQRQRAGSDKAVREAQIQSMISGLTQGGNLTPERVQAIAPQLIALGPEGRQALTSMMAVTKQDKPPGPINEWKTAREMGLIPSNMSFMDYEARMANLKAPRVSVAGPTISLGAGMKPKTGAQIMLELNAGKEEDDPSYVRLPLDSVWVGDKRIDKPETQGQSKAAQHLTGMTNASEMLAKLQSEGPGAITGFMQLVTNNPDVIGLSAAVSDMITGGNYGQEFVIQLTWADHFLRDMTGAVANKEEISNAAATYFPRGWDSAEVVALKSQLRAHAEIAIANKVKGGAALSEKMMEEHQELLKRQGWTPNPSSPPSPGTFSSDAGVDPINLQRQGGTAGKLSGNWD